MFLKRKNTLMKKIFFTFSLVFLCFFSNAQNWAPLGEGTHDQNIEIELISYDGKLFAAGEFSEIGDVAAKGIAYYSDDKWHIVDPGKNDFTSVQGLGVIKNELYAISSRSTFNILKKELMKLNRNNYRWEIIPNSAITGEINDMIEFKGKLYIGGAFEVERDSDIENLATWDGRSWKKVRDDRYYALEPGEIHDLEIFNNGLIILSQIQDNSQLRFKKIAKFDGKNWDNLRKGIQFNGATTSLATFNNKLFVGGSGFSIIPGVLNTPLVCWDGYSWKPIDQAADIPNISKIISFENRLYITDRSIQGSTLYFDGKKIKKLTQDLEGVITTLAIHDHELYVGGYFGNDLLNIPNGIARLIPELDIPNGITEFEIYPNPTYRNINLKYQSIFEVDTQIKLYDMNGLCVFEKKYLNEIGHFKKSISLPNLNSGIYYLRFEQGDIKENRKVIILN